MADKESNRHDLSPVINCKCQCGRSVDVICEDHNEIICEPCRTNEHLKCRTESIGRKSTKFKSKNLKATMKTSKDLKAKIETIKHSGNSRIGDLNEMKEKCKNDIKGFRVELNNILDKLETNTLDDLDYYHSEQCKLVENHLATLATLWQEIDKDNKILQAAKEDGRKEIMFSCDVKCSKNFKYYESTCDNIASDIKDVRLLFAKSDEMNILQNVINLGTIFINDYLESQGRAGGTSSIGTNSLSGSISESHLDQLKARKQSHTSGDDHIRLMKEQLQKEIERQSREAQEDLIKVQKDQMRQKQLQKQQMRQNTIELEKERLEIIHKQKQESESERIRKEQLRQEQLRKEQGRQEEIRERIERDRKSRQGQIQEMLMNTTQQEQYRKDLIRQQHERTEQSRLEQLKEQERLAQIRETQQEELNQKQIQQKETRQKQIQQELQRQKEVQERQQRSRQEYLRQTHKEQLKQERLRQDQLQQERIRRDKIKHEKIQQQQQEEEMRRTREDLIRQEKAQKEALRQEELRQEQMKLEQLQERQRQMREDQIRELKEDEKRQAELLKALYQNIK